MKIPYHWRQKWFNLLKRWREVRKKLRLAFHFVQDDLYEIDRVAQPYLRALSVLLALLVIASILIPIGFDLSPELVRLNRIVEGWILGGFVFNYLIRLFLTSNRLSYLRKRWFEGVMSLLSILILTDYFFGGIGLLPFITGLTETSKNITFLNFLKGYLLFLVLLKVLQYLPDLLEKQKNTGRFVVVSFLSLIALGCALLMLPGATQDGEGLKFIDALFTSTSAVCVTGLIVVDTATHFTLFGELVILTLIQLGGIGIITFATFLFIYISGGLGVGQMNTLKDMVAEKNTGLALATLKKIVGLTFTVEAIGALAYYFSWAVEFPSQGQRILFSIFHAVSAFCNAGFSLFTNSLADAGNATNLGINFTTMFLIVIGGLGFTTVWELFRSRSGSGRKRRYLSVHTRTVLYTTGILLVAGTLLILLLEWHRNLAGYTIGNKILVSLFQSVTTRTAGFNTIDIGALGIPVTLVLLTLMFIGGSPASTAGGIKTTTFAILMRSIVMTVRGYDRMELFKRTISNTIIYRAMTVVLLAGSCIVVSTILLSIIEDHDFLDLLFEEVSAFATVGLSRGITGELSSWGKAIIVVSMFWGRVGILTFMLAFSSRGDNRKYKYPEETVMVS